MDHLFEQKLVRENQQLQLHLAKLNKQLKQLQEQVVGYEQILEVLAHTDVQRQDPKIQALTVQQGKRLKGIASALNKISADNYRGMSQEQRTAHATKIERISNIMKARGVDAGSAIDLSGLRGPTVVARNTAPAEGTGTLRVREPGEHEFLEVEKNVPINFGQVGQKRREEAAKRADIQRERGLIDRRLEAKRQEKRKAQQQEKDRWTV